MADPENPFTAPRAPIQAPAPPAVDRAAGGPATAWTWWVCTLLFLATMLNYMDRQTMANVAIGIRQEFSLDHTHYGYVELAFTLVYAVAQVPMGVLADVLDLRWFYAASVLLWSLAGLGTGLVHSFAGLLALRVLLGLAESPNWPCALIVTRRLLPPRDRSLGNGFFNSGSSVGAILTPLAVLSLTHGREQNWRPPFVIIGLLGGLWLVQWLVTMRGRGPARALAAPPAPPPQTGGPSGGAAGPPALVRVLLTRQFAIVFVLAIAVNVCWHFFRIWLPQYLEEVRHLTFTQTLEITSGFYVAAAAGSLWAGWATRRLVRRGWSVDRSRKAVLLACSCCTLAAPLAAVVRPLGLSTTLLMVVGFGSLGYFANFFSYAQDVAPAMVGTIMGILGFAGHFFVAVGATSLAGLVIDWTGSWVPNLTAAGLLPLIGWIVLVLGWRSPEADRDARGA